MKRQPPAPIPTELVIIKKVQTSKLSSRSQGKLSYQIGYLPDKSAIFLNLCGNEGGGYFSTEWVPAQKLKDKLVELKPLGQFAATALKSVFIGKSSNNASFLAAVLVAEGLIQQAPDKESRLILGTDFATWSAQVLAQQGTLTRTAPEQTGNEPEAGSSQNQKGRRHGQFPSKDSGTNDSTED